MISTTSTSKWQFWQNHNLIASHIKNGGGISLDLFNKAVFDKPLFNERHLQLCQQVVSEAITVPLPVPRLGDYFTTVAGPLNPRTSDDKVAGAYYIHSDSDTESYVGRSESLGRRVREHAHGRNKNTKSFVKGLNNGKVTLYRVPVQESYEGLTQYQFLCLLETYLFIIHRPTENRSFSSTGFSPSISTIPDGERKGGATLPIYIYGKQADETLVYLYHCENTREFQRKFGVTTNYVYKLLTRSEGWFRGAILFSRVPVLPNEVPAMTMDELKKHYAKVLARIARSDFPQLAYLNNETGEMKYYPTMKQLRDAVGPHVYGSRKFSIKKVSHSMARPYLK